MRFLFIAALLASLLACNGRPSFSAADIDGATLGKGLRPGFLLGAATAAHQVEGGNSNDWTDWENSAYPDGRPHIQDQTVSGLAADSWNRFDEDVVLLRRLGANSYRLSVEWSRIEPEEGKWDEAALDRYLAWVTKLRAAGIEPVVTLHHFTLPKWVAAKGGWSNDDILKPFETFTVKVAAKLGAQVDTWCTINEPTVIAVEGYIDGIWPPGHTSTKEGAFVLARVMEAHAHSAAALRAHDTIDADGDGRATFIGVAHHVRIMQAATDSTLDTVVTGLTDDFANEAVVRAAKTGRIQLSSPGDFEIDREVPGLKDSFDYLGLNYYTRDTLRANLGDPKLSNSFVPADRPVNDLGWDIYPEGLYLYLKRFSKYPWPIYILENGMPDETGEARPAFLRAHFYALQKASDEGVDVRGYFHWSLMDNFEWAEGVTPRFGLFRVDYDNPARTRTPTPAVATFQEIARNAGLKPLE
ncbi:MAG: glycoside hydrolase family 1 protein [Myxococcaceae bacterium]